MSGKLFERGKSGNPGGRPKVPAEFKAACREHTPKALAVLVDAMEDKNPSIRLKAAEMILDRSYGKPAQSVDIAMQDAQEATLEAQRPLTRPEVNRALAELVAGAERELGSRRSRALPPWSACSGFWRRHKVYRRPCTQHSNHQEVCSDSV